MVRMNRAVLPIMRQQGGGRIVNLSSVAAPVPIPFQTYYSAGKEAVNSYTMALSNEIKPFGITVTAVMPGDITVSYTHLQRLFPRIIKITQDRSEVIVTQKEKLDRPAGTPVSYTHLMCIRDRRIRNIQLRNASGSRRFLMPFHASAKVSATASSASA